MNKLTRSWWNYRVRKNDAPKNPWWDEECRELKNDWRKEKERVFKLVFKTQEDWDGLHQKWNRYKKCCRNKKWKLESNSWSELEQLRIKSAREYWQRFQNKAKNSMTESAHPRRWQIIWGTSRRNSFPWRRNSKTR